MLVLCVNWISYTYIYVHTFLDFFLMQASLIAQLVKNPPAMQETPVQFLVWEDSLEKE